MLHRVGISMDQSDLKHITLLQKRFRIRNRSEFFRELVRRYEKLEDDYAALQRCLVGYAEHPESGEDALGILKTTLRERIAEEWQ